MEGYGKEEKKDRAVDCPDKCPFLKPLYKCSVFLHTVFFSFILFLLILYHSNNGRSYRRGRDI